MWLLSGWVIISSFLYLEVSSQRREIPPPGNDGVQLPPRLFLSSNWRDWGDDEWNYAVSQVQKQHQMEGTAIPIPDLSTFIESQNRIFRRRNKNQPRIMSSNWKTWSIDDWNEAMSQVRIQNQMQGIPLPIPALASILYRGIRLNDDSIKNPTFAGFPANKNQAKFSSSDWRDWDEDELSDAVSQVMMQQQIIPNRRSFDRYGDAVMFPPIFTAPQNLDFLRPANVPNIMSSNWRDWGDEEFNEAMSQVRRKHQARARQMNMPAIFSRPRNDFRKILSANSRNWGNRAWNRAVLPVRNQQQTQMPVPIQGWINGFNSISPFRIIRNEDVISHFPAPTGPYIFNPPKEAFRNIWNKIARKNVVRTIPAVFHPEPSSTAHVLPFDTSLNKQNGDVVRPFEEFHNGPLEISSVPNDAIFNHQIPTNGDLSSPRTVEQSTNKPTETSTQMSNEASASTLNVSDIVTSTETTIVENTQSITQTPVIVTTNTTATQTPIPVTNTLTITTTPDLTSTYVHVITTTQVLNSTTHPTTTEASTTTTDPITLQSTTSTSTTQSTTTITTNEPIETTTTQPTTTTQLTTIATTQNTTTEVPTSITTQASTTIVSSQPEDTTTTTTKATTQQPTTQPRQPGKRQERPHV